MGRTRDAYDQLGALTADRWKQEAREVKLGAVNDAAEADYSDLSPLRKRFVLDAVEHVGKQEGSETDRVLRFTISTDSVDRDGDTIAVDGWELDNYLKNPVVLFGHNYRDLPVARALDVWPEGKKLKSDAEFTDAETYAFGDTVYRMYLGGYLRAVSVGFSPSKWMWVEEDERPFGIDFIQQELLEYSAVPVPANPEALQEAKSAGIDLSPLKDYMDELEASWNEVEGGIMVPRRLVQQMVKVLHGDARTVTLGNGNPPPPSEWFRDGEPEENSGADTTESDPQRGDAEPGSSDADGEPKSVQVGGDASGATATRFAHLLIEVRSRAAGFATSGDLKDAKTEQVRREANFLAAKLLPDVGSEDFERLFPELCGDGEFTLAGLPAKSGRVLSQANEGKLRAAQERIQEVLDQLEEADEVDDEGNVTSNDDEASGTQEESAAQMEARLLEYARQHPDEVREIIQQVVREGVGLNGSPK